MKLLQEICEHEISVLEEDTPSGKKMYITGPFIQLEQVNKNNRIYPSYIDSAINSYIVDKVNTNRAMGEISHPQGATINLDRVSHLIKSLHKEGNTWYGKALITETPCGQIAKGLLSSGASLGVSTRGLGSLTPTNEGTMIVGKDYHIVTAGDLVSDPSAPGAFVKGIVENVEYYFDESTGSWIAEQCTRIKHKVRKLSKRELTEQQIGIFQKFIQELTEYK